MPFREVCCTTTVRSVSLPFLECATDLVEPLRSYPAVLLHCHFRYVACHGRSLPACLGPRCVLSFIYVSVESETDVGTSSRTPPRATQVSFYGEDQGDRRQDVNSLESCLQRISMSNQFFLMPSELLRPANRVRERWYSTHSMPKALRGRMWSNARDIFVNGEVKIY